MGVYQYEIPGVIELENGAREAVVIHLYLKGLQTGDVVTYRGSMFAESAEWEWYNWGGTGLCQPQITANWWPRVFFRCAPCCRLVHTLTLVAPVCYGKRGARLAAQAQQHGRAFQALACASLGC